MAEADDPRFDLIVAGASVGANLDDAIARGRILRLADGGLTLASPEPRRTAENGDGEGVDLGDGFLHRRGDFRPHCGFLNGLLFHHAYRQTQVPFGCRTCFKIKIETHTLRQLMATRAIAEDTPYSTKSGSEADLPTNACRYATYLYFSGLDAARRAFPELRRRINDHPDLGTAIQMVIKRGCSNFERKCGPSDQYRFDPRQEALEDALHRRWVKTPRSGRNPDTTRAMTLLALVAIAYRIGDPTYLDFTGGRPLHTPLVSYPPEEPAPVMTPG